MKKLTEIQRIGLICQVMFGLATVGAVVFYFFENAMVDLVYVMIGFLLLAVAYNNHTIYKRKYLTVIYLIAAGLAFLTLIL